ncbi:MAG TPA: DUF1318 domain-containing protein [Rhizomicrobium sp.]|jgi:uncharacterized protein YdbL (DUF1318 family)|nr:DUF1318 domain-containing protein [Rhizomicrobium sp.]
MKTFAKTKIAAAFALLFVLVQPAFADLAGDKAAVDAAKVAGTVGEQADGYLGYVKGSADAATTAAVTAINAARADVYAQTAAKSGVSRDAAGQATGAQLIAKVPAGGYYKPLGGAWTKK